MIQPLDNNHFKLLPVSLQEKLFGTDARFLFGRMGVHGDGTCFFHSLCAALNHKQYLFQDSSVQQRIGHEYRRTFTALLTPERIAAFEKEHHLQQPLNVEHLKRQFKDDKTWADETMIKLVSDVLGLNIIFIDTDKNKLYCGVRGEKDEPLIVILWVNHAHFEPMCRVMGLRAEEKEVKVQFQFSLFTPQDQEVVEMMMSNYSAQCSS